jgi:hypothetical protein
MTTKLEGPLRREIEIDGAAYTLTITPQAMMLVPKGRRKGYELEWRALVSGDAALATALNASLRAGPAPKPDHPPVQGRRRGRPIKTSS